MLRLPRLPAAAAGERAVGPAIRPVLLLLRGGSQAGAHCGGVHCREVSATRRPKHAGGGPPWEHAKGGAHGQREGHAAELPLHGRELVCNARVCKLVLHCRCCRRRVIELVPVDSTKGSFLDMCTQQTMRCTSLGRTAQAGAVCMRAHPELAAPAANMAAAATAACCCMSMFMLAMCCCPLKPNGIMPGKPCVAHKTCSLSVPVVAGHFPSWKAPRWMTCTPACRSARLPAAAAALLRCARGRMLRRHVSLTLAAARGARLQHRLEHRWVLLRSHRMARQPLLVAGVVGSCAPPQRCPSSAVLTCSPVRNIAQVTSAVRCHGRSPGGYLRRGAVQGGALLPQAVPRVRCAL